MFPRCYVDFCPRCGETTPHEDHRFGRWLALSLGYAGIAFVVFFGGIRAWGAVLFLLYSGLWFGLDRHERHVNERCTRCRHKARKAWRKTQPDPRNSTIDI
jgi:hypothetical protein